jgi:hypothetical protein
MRPDESPVTNLFGGSLGLTLNKRQSIEREKSGHTPARKKHGHTTCRASSVWARVAIQEALSAEMSSLHVDDSLSRRVELLDKCRTMIVTPDGDEDDEQCIDNLADDSDYDDAPVANPTPKLLPRKIRNKKSEPKLTLNRNFMCFLRPHTFDHELFRRGKEDIYSIAEMERFDADYRRQLHFNFSATRTTQKQKQAFDAPRASRLRDVDLVTDIDIHVFTNEDGVDDNGMDDEEQEMMMEIGGLMMRPCLMDLVLVGWNKLKEMNVKKIRMVADERVQHKRTTTKYIMDRVKSMKNELMSASIPDEQENEEESE